MHAPPAPTRAWRPALRNRFTRGTYVTYPAVQLQETSAESPGAGLPTRPAPSVSRFLIPLLAGIFTVLAIAGLRLAASLLVPIAIAVMMTLLLGPLVRGMRKYRVAEPVGAGIIVFGTAILFLIGAVVLAGPAAEWLRRAPVALREVEGKLRSLEPVSAIQETASSLTHAARGTTKDSATALVEIVTRSPLQQIGWKTANVIGEILTVTFLTYFLLAGGSMFRRKLAYLFPSGTRRTRIKRALLEIEEQMSRYLLINTLISVGFGVATWGLLAAIGIPNPILWGFVAGVLNYVPYLGALVTVILIGVVSLASFDGTEHVVLACGGFLLLDLVKGNLLSPMVIGRKMPLNTAAVFVSLLFWGWVWGIPGVIMAVPLTVMVQVISSHSERFRGLGILLGQWGSQRIS
jgi:predicted PurR-regulated permease PerM